MLVRGATSLFQRGPAKQVKLPLWLAVRANRDERKTKQYLERQASDQYSRRAREHDYRARSAFKLLQINAKMGQFIRPGLVAIDAGAVRKFRTKPFLISAPGSWCQVLSELMFPDDFGCSASKNSKRSERRSAGYILGIDLLPIAPIDNVDLLCCADITKSATRAEVRRRLGGRRVQLLLSDMAPNPTGDSRTDHMRILALCRSLLEFGAAPDPEPLLAPNGTFLCKMFEGTESEPFVTELRRRFALVKKVKPDASRDTSSEIYYWATGFREEPVIGK